MEGKPESGNNSAKELVDQFNGQAEGVLTCAEYVIIHIVLWKQDGRSGQGSGGGTQATPGRAESKYRIASEHWYLYRNDALAKKSGVRSWGSDRISATRIFGSRKVGLLLIHVGEGTGDANPVGHSIKNWDIEYTVSVKEKRARNVQNLLDLLAVVTSAATRDARQAEPVRFIGLWGGRLLAGIPQPSDIEVSGNVLTYDPPSIKTEEARQTAQFAKTYDNEGLHYWDVSIGLQAKAINELQYNADDGTVRNKTVTRQNAFGFLDLYLSPVDLTGKGKGIEIPHFVVGLPLSGKPLDRPMIGLGIGVNKFSFKFNLFAGAVFNKVSSPKTLAEGASASNSQLASDLRYHRVTKFIFGVNIPVKQFTDQITKK
jgi:hypothetical protein